MKDLSYLTRPGRPTLLPLTLICAAVFFATAVLGIIEALALDQEANALAAAPLCVSSALTTGCRLHVDARVVGGYDLTSGLAPERQIDVTTATGAAVHLTSGIVGAPPQIGSSVGLDYWRGKLVRFSTSAGTFRTPSHPSSLSRLSRLLAWFGLGLALLCSTAIRSASQDDQPGVDLDDSAKLRIGVNRWFFVRVGLIIFFLGFSDLATDGFTNLTLIAGLKQTGWLLLAFSMFILNAVGRTVTITPDGVRYLRRSVAFASIARVTLEPGRLPFSGMNNLTIYPLNAGKPLSINMKYFGRRNRIRLVRAVSSRSSVERFDASSTALLDGAPVGKEAAPAANSTRQSQNRGCATSLVGVGSALIAFGLFFEPLGGPPIGGLWAYLVGAIFVGVGIHRNIRVLRAHFGRRRGDILGVFQTIAPFIAWGIDTSGELSSGGSTRLLFRFLSLLPFIAVWLLVWLPLSKVDEPIASETRVA